MLKLSYIVIYKTHRFLYDFLYFCVILCDICGIMWYFSHIKIMISCMCLYAMWPHVTYYLHTHLFIARLQVYIHITHLEFVLKAKSFTWWSKINWILYSYSIVYSDIKLIFRTVKCILAFKYLWRMRTRMKYKHKLQYWSMQHAIWFIISVPCAIKEMKLQVYARSFVQFLSLHKSTRSQFGWMKTWLPFN